MKTLYLDQYCNKFYADTVKSLKQQIGKTKASRMYVDGKDGKTYHIGYVIGEHWLTAFQPIRNAIN
jgi:hypothetical protein